MCEDVEGVDLICASLAAGGRRCARLVRAMLAVSLMLAAISGAAFAGPLEDSLAAHENGDDATAFSEFRKAAQADPRDTTSRLNMGVVLLHAGAYAKAEEQYREILRQSPDNAPAEVGLAAALRGAADGRHPHNLDEARALLEKVLAADSHNTSALFNLAVLMADFVKKPTEAAPLFKRFLADAPAAHPLRAEAERYVAAAAASGAPKDVSHGPR